MSDIYTSDVLIIGAGLAGERIAIAAAQQGLNVIILSLVPPKRSHSAAAQGGMQAALANAKMGAGDNETLHWLDTLKGSDWGADQEVCRLFADNAPIAMREMAHYGVPWNRVKGGPADYFIKGEKATVEEDHDKEGLITARAFGGTAKWRTCYTADGTGHSVLYTMDNMAIQLGVTVHDRMEALGLVHEGGVCKGAVVRSLRNGSLNTYFARATVIATGGYGRIYGHSTNAVINEGTGNAMALNTGVVPLGNMEAVQFHPTGIVPTDILVTEGCRGDGGYLLDVDEYRFMPDYEPAKMELASRDVVSRRMKEHMLKGKGVHSPYGDHLWLDLRHLGAHHLHTKLREVYDICKYFIGVDPITELVPVRPTQHYSMGGIRVNKDGLVYNMQGLFSAGESACWDLHGFNRLGGNSLAETIVAGMIVGRHVARYAQTHELESSTTLAGQFLNLQKKRIDNLYNNAGTESMIQIKKDMAKILSDNVGIFRTGEGLQAAVEEFKKLYRRSLNIKVSNSTPGRNVELTESLKLQGMVKLGFCIAAGAEARKESRGAHTRDDFPARDDANWLNRTLARWPEGAMEPELSYEPVGTIDMPPGDRGYGGGQMIPMGVTVEEYNAAVDELQKKNGKHETDEPFNAGLKPGLWQKEVK